MSVLRLLCVLVCSLQQISASYIWAPAKGSYAGYAQKNLTVYRMRSHGLQDWRTIGGSVTGALIFMDCYALAGCAIACESWPMYPSRGANPPISLPGFGRRLGHGAIPCYNMTTYTPPSGRRQLAHGGASSWSRPATIWAPDFSAPNNKFCDMRTQVNPARTAAEDLIGVVTMGWVVTCVVVPRDITPMVNSKASGLKGWMVTLAPAISNMISLNSKYNQQNAVPDWPVLIGSEGAQFDDEANFLAPTMLSMSNENVTLYLTATDDPCVIWDMLNHPGSMFLFYLCGIVFCLLAIYALYVLLKMKARVVSWAGYVVFVEGVICGALRAWKAFDMPYLFNGNLAIDISHWLSVADAPFASSTTFVTAAVWTRVIFFMNSGNRTKLVFNIVVWFFVLGIMGAVQWIILTFPLQPWETFGLTFSTSRALREFAAQPTIVITSVLLGIFVLTTAIALFKLRNVAKLSPSMAATIRGMLPWIFLQNVGLIIYCSGFFVEAEINFIEEAFPPHMTFVARHFQLIGSALSAIGQVFALAQNHKTSSSSSSSSSSS